VPRHDDVEEDRQHRRHRRVHRDGARGRARRRLRFERHFSPRFFYFFIFRASGSFFSLLPFYIYVFFMFTGRAPGVLSFFCAGLRANLVPIRFQFGSNLVPIWRKLV
jgi:hypothetical protein